MRKKGILAIDCEILEIGVNKGLRGNGYGSELLRFAETHHSKDNIHRIVVETYAASYGVIYFYGKNGYAPIAVIPGTNGPDDEGTIIMRKPLSSSSNK